jgi:two-component system NarL family response regulator
MHWCAPRRQLPRCRYVVKRCAHYHFVVPPPITILTADDHGLIRAGLSAIMETEADLAIVAEAENGEEAIEQFEVHRPDVVLMDLRMPVMDGLVATRAILADHPDARIIVLSTYDGDADIYRALEAGARGYALKDMLRTEILTMVRKVHRGECVIPTPVAARLEEHTPRVELTPREMEVFQLVARGWTNAEIAAQIGRTEWTVKVHVKNILRKLDAHDRTEAVTMGLKRGFIRLV